MNENKLYSKQEVDIIMYDYIRQTAKELNLDIYNKSKLEKNNTNLYV